MGEAVQNVLNNDTNDWSSNSETMQPAANAIGYARRVVAVKALKSGNAQMGSGSLG
jgi:hypothetical protein